MAVPKTKTINQFIANSGDTKFYFTFLIYDANDILVYRRPKDAKGSDKDFLLLLDKDYKVTFNPSTYNNYIEFIKPCLDQDIITISCNLIIKRDLDYNFNSEISSNELNAQNDKIIRFIQQIADKVDYRSLNYQASSDLKNSSTALPILKKNELWLGDTDNIITINTDDIGKLGASQSKIYLDEVIKYDTDVREYAGYAHASCDNAYAWANRDFNVKVDDGIHQGYSAYHWMMTAQLVVENGGCTIQEKFFAFEATPRNKFQTNWMRLKPYSFSLYIDGKRYPSSHATIDSDGSTIILDFATEKDVLITRNESEGGDGLASADMSNVQHPVKEYIDVLANIGVAKNDLSNIETIKDTFFNLIFTTGEIKATVATTAPNGWIILNDGTIGSSKSKATTRAHDDTKNLFMLLWHNVAGCNVHDENGLLSKGLSSENDWLANKTISLPKVLGRTFAASGAGADLTERKLGETLGSEKCLSSDTKGTITFKYAHASNSGSVPVLVADSYSSPFTNNVDFATHAENDSNMPPTIFLNWMIKL